MADGLQLIVLFPLEHQFKEDKTNDDDMRPRACPLMEFLVPS
jgi:hypothetical protein